MKKLISLFTIIAMLTWNKPLIDSFDEEVLVTQRGEKIFVMNFSDKEKCAKVNGEKNFLKPYEIIIV